MTTREIIEFASNPLEAWIRWHLEHVGRDDNNGQNKTPNWEIVSGMGESEGLDRLIACSWVRFGWLIANGRTNVVELFQVYR